MQSRSCSIPSVRFTQSPYSLAWGVSIVAKVIAINIKGKSLASDSGNGAILLTIPDAPINLTNVAHLTNAA
jgi:hypothetical protein